MNTVSTLKTATYSKTNTIASGSIENESKYYSSSIAIWSKNITEINSASKLPIFIDTMMLPPSGMPSNHPAWKELETMLMTIDEIPNYADDLDNNWLDNLRSGWSDRLSDFYDTENWD